MSKKMLIDASHQEETRVVIVNGSRIEELDFESSSKRQLRGNVYLARVTRVEPSLQAAFVEYGGNRHGFLAFSEIHPDYYQIPYEDRMALIEAEEADNLAEEEDDDVEETSDADADDDHDDDDLESSDDDVEVVADEQEEDVADEQAKTANVRRKRMSRRRYKIQEVIKRGQILLIQVVKEERGNKGAAMTTYLSLAGRYCVLMPNTPRGGGISRKIPNGADRKRLKSIVSEFEVPQGMGVIVRTAGAKRTKLEIKRDYDYLCRLWETTRNTTLKSIAPALIHEEGNLVKRSIRDLYNKDIDEVLVQGEEAYKTAKNFIKMLMPSHAKNVKSYKEEIPLFLRYHVESQIEDSLDPTVQLKSGGYLVIHPTEALVSVDVNSGRSTKERNVERTALKTNLEAADEVARQMRLRDLAGLIVIDFIDMDESRNNRAVEKRMKDALARDRARVQSSRISQFGLMEISRQRRRRSLLEGSTAHCEHCAGVGRKRTIESSALRAIRAVEEVGVRRKAKRIRLRVASDVALYIFNEKRDLLTSVDDEFNVFTELVGDDTLIRPAYEVEILEAAEDGGKDPLIQIEKDLKKQEQSAAKTKAHAKPRDDEDEDDEEDEETSVKDVQSDDDDQPKRRRRRGRRGGRRRKPESESSEGDSSETESGDESDDAPVKADDEKGAEKRPRRRRRPARSGNDADAAEAANAPDSSDASSDVPESESKPKRRRRKAAPETSENVETEEQPQAKSEDKPRSTTRRKAPAKKPKVEDIDTSVEAAASAPSSQRDAQSSRPAVARSTARRKAPAKKVSAETAPEPIEPAPVKETKPSASAGDKPRSSARRKAPAKKTASTDTAETVADVSQAEAPKSEAPKPAKTKKAPARRKAPARKSAPAAKKADAEPASIEPAKPAAEKPKPVKTPARRKAPARKTDVAADTPADAPKAEKAESAPARKAAPRKKAPTATADPAPTPAPQKDETPQTAETPKADDAKSDESKETTKRGWWQRRKRK